MRILHMLEVVAADSPVEVAGPVKPIISPRLELISSFHQNAKIDGCRRAHCNLRRG